MGVTDPLGGDSEVVTKAEKGEGAVKPSEW